MKARISATGGVILILALQAAWITHAATGESPSAQSQVELRGEITVKDPEALRFNSQLDFSNVDVDFSDATLGELRKGEDYEVFVEHNYIPGEATVWVYGMGNFTGTLSTTAEILKGYLNPEAFRVHEDQGDMTYDGYTHYVSYDCTDNYAYGYKITYTTLASNVGNEGGSSGSDYEIVYDESGEMYVVFPDGLQYPAIMDDEGNLYMLDPWTGEMTPLTPSSGEEEDPGDTVSVSNPTKPGTYDVWVEMPENDYYLALPKTKIGSMEIYPVDMEQISMFMAMEPELVGLGYEPFNWNTYYPENNRWHYDPILNFHNGKIKSIRIHSRPNDPEGEAEGGVDVFPYGLLDFSQLEELDLSGCRISGDITDIAMKIAEDPTKFNVASMLQRLDLSNNRISGDLGVFGILFQNLKYLYLDDNCLSQISQPLPQYLNSVSFARQQCDGTIDIDFTNIDIDRLMAQVPTLALYNPSFHSFDSSLNVTISEDPQFYGYTDSFGLIFTINYTDGNLYISIPDSYGNSTYKGELEKEFYISLGAYYSASEGLRMKAGLKFIPHDINFDFSVNVADLQSIVNYILEQNYWQPFNFTQADLYADDRINAQDLVKNTGLMLSMAPQPFATEESAALKKVRRHSPADEQTATPRAYIYEENGAVYLESEADIAAIDLAASAGETPVWGEMLKEAGFTVTTRSDGTHHRLIAYSVSGVTLPAGRHLIASRLEGSLTGGSVSSADAKEIPLFRNVSTGVGTTAKSSVKATRDADRILISADSPADWKIYTLSGIMVASGSTDAGETRADIQAAAGQPVILVVTTASETKTFKL